MNKEKNKSRNKIKDYKELSEIEEVNDGDWAQSPIPICYLSFILFFINKLTNKIKYKLNK